MHGMVVHFVCHAHDFYRVPLFWTLMAKKNALICLLAIIYRLTI
jgi:hypothetical protein